MFKSLTMRPSTELQGNIDNDPQPGNFEFRPQKRRNSLPSPRREIWTSWEKPHVPGETPTRSISPPLEVWPESITQGLNTSTSIQYNYGSDEEDRRSGVPIRYADGECHPFQKSMKHEVETKFQRLKQRHKELSATLDKWKGPYEEGRRLYFETRGLGWTKPQWNQFLSTENSYFDVRDKLFAVEDKMEHNTAQMYLFKEPVSLSLNSGVWLREEDTAVWSLEGAAEQRAKSSEHPVLEWRGVDYNATKWTDEPSDPSCEHCEDLSSLA
ncbi:hypothetical protein F4680DRAFT_275243 [Xylaria scruposa]|nr:hypothetical protein F4680DRAFT_275243 [Xylaria scruposa]